MTNLPPIAIDIPELTEVEFHEIRRRGIGGSDVAAVLGLDPFRGPHDIWLAKMGKEKYEESEAAFWGKVLEPFVLDRYAERERVTLAQLAPAPDVPYAITNPKRPRFLQHRTETWMRATVDAVVKDAKVGVDAKTKLDPYWSRDEWGDNGTDAVPKPILCQCTWYMGITGFARWDVPVLWGNGLKTYRVFFNPRLFEILATRCDTFWRTYVLGRTPPPLTDPDISHKVVEKVYPRNLVEIREADEIDRRLVALYRETDDRYDALDAMRKKIEAAICARIAKADGLKGDFGKIYWKRAKDQHPVDWEQVAWKLQTEFGIPAPVFEEIKHEFTTTREGKRSFRHYWKGEETDGHGATEGPATLTRGRNTDPRAIAAGKAQT